MERAKGIEPSCAAWKAAVLPLNYARGDTAQTQGLRLHRIGVKVQEAAASQQQDRNPKFRNPEDSGRHDNESRSERRSGVLRGALVDKDGGERGIRTPEG